MNVCRFSPSGTSMEYPTLWVLLSNHVPTWAIAWSLFFFVYGGDYSTLYVRSAGSPLSLTSVSCLSERQNWYLHGCACRWRQLIPWWHIFDLSVERHTFLSSSGIKSWASSGRTVNSDNLISGLIQCTLTNWRWGWMSGKSNIWSFNQ